MVFTKETQNKIRNFVRKLKPRKQYMKGKVKNYWVNKYSITIDDFTGCVCVYDLVDRRVVDETEVVNFIKNYKKQNR